MIEDYDIKLRIGRGHKEGKRIIYNGKTVDNIVYKTTYVTAVGEFAPDDWKEKALKEIQAFGEMELLERIKMYCRAHCAWLRSEKSIEEYAIECLCGRAYLQWNGFSGFQNIK